MEIGKKIRNLRLEKEVKQEELAEYLGVSIQAVSKWETEASVPDIALLPGIAVFFGSLTPEHLEITHKASNGLIFLSNFQFTIPRYS